MNSSSARELSAMDDPDYEWADEEADCPVGALAESAPASTAANRARSSMDDPDREWQEADCFSNDQLGAQVLEAPMGQTRSAQGEKGCTYRLRRVLQNLQEILCQVRWS